MVALRYADLALQLGERLLDAMQMGMFTAAHPLIFRTLQRAEDEAMGGGEHAHLQRVLEALSQLKKMGAGA